MGEKWYNAKDVQQNIKSKKQGNFTLTGFGDGDLFSYSADQENVTVGADAQGTPWGVINNSGLATVNVTLAAGSPQYPKMLRMANDKEVFQYSAVTPYETITAAEAIIVKQPDINAGKSAPDRGFQIKLMKSDVKPK